MTNNKPHTIPWPVYKAHEGWCSQPQVEPTITVAGVTFNSSEVKSAVIVKGGREIVINEKLAANQIGFKDNE